MKKRNIIYISISAVCALAIIIGVYFQIFGQKKQRSATVLNTVENTISNNVDDLTLEEIKEQFNSLFSNDFDDQGYDISTIKKINGLENQNVIYAAFNIKEENGKYSVNINLPVFNIEGDVAADFNKITQSVFADKANEILSNVQNYTIYNVDYASYLNDNILSLVIKSTLKEGNNAQRLIVQTYNYDIETGKKLSLNDVLDKQEINKKDVNKKIEKIVEEANNQSESISQAISLTGQTVYKRDLDNAMYVTDNVNNFFLGENGRLYIVYAYGNNNPTSEIDIIIVE